MPQAFNSLSVAIVPGSIVLGCPVAITDQNGVLQDPQANDAWGKRRSQDGGSTDDAVAGRVDKTEGAARTAELTGVKGTGLERPFTERGR